MKKLISIILCLILALSLFAGCSSNADSEVPSEGTDVPAVEAGVFVDGEKIDIDTVMTIGEHEVPFDLYRYFYLAVKSQIEQGDATLWESEDAAEATKLLDESVISNLKNLFVFEDYAKELDLSLTDEEIKAFNEETQAVIDANGGQEAFEKAIIASNCTMDIFTQIGLNYELQNKVFIGACGDKLKDSLLSGDYVRASHILVGFDTSSFVPTEVPEDATEEEKAEIDTKNAEDYAAMLEIAKADAKTKAEEILAKVEAGDDFDALIAEYGEDPGMANSPDGYCFTTGEMVEPFEKSAFSLEENATSGLVETTYGYHIIKRLPLDDEYINTHSEDLLYKNAELTEQFSADVYSKMEAMEVVYVENYDKISPLTLK